MVLLGQRNLAHRSLVDAPKSAHATITLSIGALCARNAFFAVSSERYVLISAIAISAIFNAPAALLVFDALYINLLISWEGYPVRVL